MTTRRISRLSDLYWQLAQVNAAIASLERFQTIRNARLREVQKRADSAVPRHKGVRVPALCWKRLA